jgi:hypothetical protein
MKSVSTSTTDRSLSSPQRSLEDVNIFNQHNKADCLRLKEWCTYHWYGTIKKSIDSMNPAIYHDCCFSFSRRHFSKRANHKPLESASVLRIPSFKSLHTHDDFYKWIMDKIKVHEKLGRKAVFPSINKHHIEDQTLAEEEDELLMLSKRCQKLGDELYLAQGTIDKLSRDNKRLLDSSINWFSKYQESVECTEKSDYLYHTPKKPLFIEDSSPGS